MSNRTHDQLLAKYPFLRGKARGVRANGPDKWMKRTWNQELRATWKQLARRDFDETTWPTKAGERWDWY